MRNRPLVRAASILLLALATAGTQARTLVEYYHEGLDHYFITGDAREIFDLDSGVHRGWARTGQTLAVFDDGDPRLANSVPVCRFYGNPARGLDSHFYAATPQECADVKQKFPDDWLLESDEVFRMHPPGGTTGTCPAGTTPVYRLYNQRADVNHRYTGEASVVQAMLARGYVLEGVGGPLPVVFCSAAIEPSPPSGTTPTCTLAASTTSPAVGSMLTLTASCTEAPTAYLWTNCTSTTSVCDKSETAPGPRTYYVNGRNASGVGPAATIVVNWQQPANAPPVCTLSANPAVPYVGGTTTLTANCTQSPSSFAWTGCTGAAGNACVATSATTGPATYAVTATNAFGTSAPASITLDWQQQPTTGPDLCSSYPKVKRIDLVWGGFTNTNDPGGGFEADAVLVGRIRVPPTAAGTSIPGLVSVVEFVDGAVDRILTLSPSACDFRGLQPGVFPATDPTGATAPLAWSFGIAASTQFALAGMASSAPKLVPGQDYFVNVQNRRYGDGLISCPTPECNVRVTVNAPR